MGRLEREEKERFEVVRLEKLAEMKAKIEEEKQRIRDDGGVVYKGKFHTSPCSTFAESSLN
jgi:peptidyl-prolyl isomerase G (cyclophilin G)